MLEAWLQVYSSRPEIRQCFKRTTFCVNSRLEASATQGTSTSTYLLIITPSDLNLILGTNDFKHKDEVFKFQV